MDRLVIVTKDTPLEELVLRFHSEGAARFMLESRGQSIDTFKRESLAYQSALAEVRRQIPNDLPVASVKREAVPQFLFREKDAVVVCGPDGLFVNVAKYLRDQPIIGLNPDPSTVGGALMRFSPRELGAVLERLAKGEHHTEALPLIKATVDDEHVLWAVNDVFVGRKDHISARYNLSFATRKERQSSSGIIVSSGTGATGWMRSVVAMLEGLAPGRSMHLLRDLPEPTDDELIFVVREPFPSPMTGVSLISGRIDPTEPLIVVSEMPEGGYIFSDGVIEKAISWNAGSKAVVSVGERYVQRVIG